MANKFLGTNPSKPPVIAVKNLTLRFNLFVETHTPQEERVPHSWLVAFFKKRKQNRTDRGSTLLPAIRDSSAAFSG